MQTVRTTAPAQISHPLGEGRKTTLEALRGFASTYVVIHHLGYYFHVSQSHWFFPFRFGQEAVMLFFLLSGIVIRLSVNCERPLSFRQYFIKRSRRIYPIFVAALAITYLASCHRAGRIVQVNWNQLLGNLLMLQDFKLKPGAFFEPYLGNGPLWSLSYEWWFYMLFFPVFRYVPRRMQLLLVSVTSGGAVLCYGCIPNGISLYLMYFLIWWVGVEVAVEYIQSGGHVTIAKQMKVFIAMAMVILLWIVVTLFIKNMLVTSSGLTPLVQIRHFAASILVLAVGIIWRSRFGLIGFSGLMRHFCYIGPISYALYAFHWPILITSQLFALTLSDPLRLCVLLAVIVALAYFMEVQVQKRINLWTKSLYGCC